MKVTDILPDRRYQDVSHIILARASPRSRAVARFRFPPRRRRQRRVVDAPTGVCCDTSSRASLRTGL